MKQEYVFGGVGAVLGSVGTALQVNELLQTISLVITILGGIVSFIIVPIISWRSKAKQDGKISDEELEEAAHILDEGAKKTKEEIEKERNKNDG